MTLDTNEVKKDSSATDNIPKSKQLLEMVSFRIVPAFFREIERVAKRKKVTISKLVRTYIKDGLKRDGEVDNEENKNFRVD